MSNNDIKKLELFFRNHTKIYLYGAGNVAKMVAGYLKKHGLEYEGFCVTKITTNEKTSDVVEFVDIMEDTDIGFLVAVASKSAHQIVEKLEKKKVDYLYDSEILFQIFQEKCSDSSKCITSEEGCITRVAEWKFDKNTTYIVCPASIGDTLYVAALVKAYKTYYGVQKVCLIVKESHASFIKMFHAIDEIIISNQVVSILDEYSMYEQIWKLDNYIYGHFKKNIRFIYDEEYFSLKNIKSRYANLIMGLPTEVKFEVCERSGNKLDIGGKKYIVLMPYAQTCPLISETYWKKLADYLLARGYEVYTNVGNKNEKVIDGSKVLMLPLDETASFCEAAICVISLRSGICDLLGFTNSNLLVVNSEKEFYEEWNLNDVLDRNGIENINVYDEMDIEYCLEKTIMRLMDFIDKE